MQPLSDGRLQPRRCFVSVLAVKLALLHRAEVVEHTQRRLERYDLSCTTYRWACRIRSRGKAVAMQLDNIPARGYSGSRRIKLSSTVSRSCTAPSRMIVALRFRFGARA